MVIVQPGVLKNTMVSMSLPPLEDNGHNVIPCPERYNGQHGQAHLFTDLQENKHPQILAATRVTLYHYPLLYC